MIARPRGGLGLAVALAGLAGWVDAVGFIRLNQIFVSFMSGNSTETGVALATRDWTTAVRLLGVVALFVTGVALGESSRGLGPRWGRALCLGAEALLLGLAAVAAGSGRGVLAAVSMTLAMGVQNASVHQAGVINVGITYVTGTLVQLGRAIGDVLWRRGRLSTPLPYAALWLGLVTGGVLGGVAATASMQLALAIAAGVACLAAIYCAVPARSEGASGSHS